MKKLKFVAKILGWFAACVVLGLLAVALVTARRPANPVGYHTARVETGSGPVAVAVWYPTSSTPWPTTFTGSGFLSVAADGDVSGNKMPLVVISHGNGGSAMSHVDLALALASAGYVVAAPTHAGDNFADQSRQAAPALFSQRAGQIRSTLDFVLEQWSGRSHVDASRVGAYGMSAGGFTVLTLVGGTPRMDAIAEHCRQTPEFICQVLASLKSPLLASGDHSGEFKSDGRIKAAVIAAPGLGFTFKERGLAQVHVPVQIWSGDKDQTVPAATNTDIIVEGLGSLAEPHVLVGATHFSFLAPCTLIKPKPFCSDSPGFDREKVHDEMNAQVVEFLDERLPGNSPSN